MKDVVKCNQPYCREEALPNRKKCEKHAAAARARGRRQYAKDPERKKRENEADPELHAKRVEGTRKWNRLHLEEDRQRHRKNRAAKHSVESEPYTTDEIAERDSNVCHICGLEVLVEDRHIDHVVPMAKGGSDTRVNVRLAHSWCNRNKGAHRWTTWNPEHP